MIILNRCSPIRQILRRCHTEAAACSKVRNPLTAFFGKWPESEQQEFVQHMRIIPVFHHRVGGATAPRRG
ncbi:GL20812 [Drosophila persimilis]|uniref:GL20812 n=1 Tax=Drosophila persimilis TaxID=7234 RepID=B4H464_DROPE|nr:GL20812 [Drosophila persimilis]